MKCTIPEISWHNREPVLSVDIYPLSNDFYRLATGGGDCHALIWQMTISDNGAIKQELISDLTRHQRAVNCVRWSPSGQYLATADDDANIIIWQQKTDNVPLLEGETNDKEIWINFKVLRGHKEDIYDLCWSVDSTKLLSGSIDNTAILWDIMKGKLDHILTDHKGFVQGVTWDPKNQLIATISTDRICRVFDTTGKHVKARILKGILPVDKDHPLYEKEVKYFHDDTFKSFFRRLQFTPDGSLLVVPSGHMESDTCKKSLNATLVFSLDNLASPVAILPVSRQHSTVVRCCPILFELKENGPDPLIKLPYRMIIAVGTDHDIILYDTQQKNPFARIQDIHYTRLTDLSWSHDGLILVASSTDGFCSLITFDMNEIGVPYIKEDSETEENVLEMSGIEESVEKHEEMEENKEDKKKSSFLLQWAAKKTKLEEKEIKSNVKVEEAVEKKVTKRITPIKIGEANHDKYKINMIEVRKKPRSIEEISKDKNETVTVNGHSTEECNKIIKEENDDVKNKDEILEIKEVKQEEIISKQPETISNKDETNKKANKQDIIEIKDVISKKPVKRKLNVEENSSPKIKVSSLVRKKVKQNETPPKQNALLSFLKKSSEKAKIQNSKKKESPKSKKQLILEPVINLADEDNAVLEPIPINNENNKIEKIAKSDILDEDCTEDFTLQLDENSKEKTEILETKPKTENTEKKTPRKVPFITLSSPKRPKIVKNN